MKYRLQDLIDIEHFQNLQDRLNEICSFPSSIIDNDGNILTATAWQDICTQFHRKNKGTELFCIKSDQYIQSHIHEANPAVSYRCPHGLVDNATPIIIEGIHYGNFFTGQFFLEEPDLNFFKAQAKKYGFDEEAYLEAVKKVPIWTQDQLESYLYFIKGLIAVISESGLKKLKEMEIRKQIEKSEKRHRSILKTAMDGYWLTDTDGRLLEINDTYCDMSGYSQDELLTMHIGDLEAFENPQIVAKHMDKVVSQGSDRFESKHRRKDGTIFDIEVSVQFRPEEGEQCVCFLRDITERKQFEETIRESEARFRMLYEKAPLGYQSLDENGRFIQVNQMWLDTLGYFREEVIGKSFADFLHPDWRDHFKENFPRFKSIGEVLGVEFEMVKKNGAFILVSFNGKIGKDKNGNFQQTHCIFHDITERRRTEEKLRVSEARLQQAQKMESVGSLAGGIAHDLNNILFPISGLSEMLLDEIPPDTPTYESIEQIHKSAQRGSDLVKQILAFSRQSSPKKLPIRIQSILKETLKLARATIPMNIAITSHIGTDCGLVSADPTQVHQIVMNLITNAYHAVEGSGGTIHVALKEAAGGWNNRMSPPAFGENDASPVPAMPGDLLADRYACISISDTGIGMDQALIDKIFDPYFTTKELGKGTGLGLSVVHGIVKEHGGDIRVYSELGKGTAFHVYLPLLEDANDGMTAAVTGKYPTGCESILLVDDEAPIVRMEQMMLERLGYRVTVRTSSPDALAIFRADPGNFNLVISDRGMPNMTGEQLAVELISIRPGIPIILCTGFSDEADVQRASAMGIKGFLMKPVATGDLAELVRKVLDEVVGSLPVRDAGTN